MSAYPCLPLLRPRRAFAGFTLIELLVVIIIVGILMAIGIPAYLSYQAKAKDTDAKATLRTAYKAALAGDSEVSNGKFPVASTIVADIQADEPGISVARGSCLSGLGSAATKQVLVDPASSATQIIMCIPSASGAIWKLSGPLTGDPTVTDVSFVALMFSGNEITDLQRAEGASTVNTVGHSYDRRLNDSSTGIWESSTNLLTNGGFESLPTSAGTGGLMTRTLSTDARFGSSSLQTVTNDGALDSFQLTPKVPVAPSTTYTASMWIKLKNGSGPMNVQFQQHSNTAGYYFGPITTLTNSWQYVVETFTTSASENGIYPMWAFKTATSVGDGFLVDGVQVEQKPFATPYIETNGATATRAGASIQAPTTLTDSSQGWVAMRVRMPFASNQDYGLAAGFRQPNLFSLTDGTLANRIHVFWYSGPQQWNIIVDRGGTSVQVAPASGNSFAAGAVMTVIGKWTSSQAGISINGAAFTTQAVGAGTWPASGVTFNIGGFYGNDGYQADADILWFATGTGTLTDADAATINGFGNNDPKRSSFPAAAQATMAWDGTSSAGTTK